MCELAHWLPAPPSNHISELLDPRGPVLRRRPPSDRYLARRLGGGAGRDSLCLDDRLIERQSTAIVPGRQERGGAQPVPHPGEVAIVLGALGACHRRIEALKLRVDRSK